MEYQKYLKDKKNMEDFVNLNKTKKFILENAEPHSIFQVVKEAVKAGFEEEVFNEAFRQLRDEGKVRLTEDHIIHIL